MSMRTGWLFTRKLWIIPDSNDSRVAFGAGAQHVLDAIRNMDTRDDAALRRIADDVGLFGQSAKTIRALADLTNLEGLAHVRAPSN